jgi:hypothetical protein
LRARRAGGQPGEKEEKRCEAECSFHAGQDSGQRMVVAKRYEEMSSIVPKQRR